MKFGAQSTISKPSPTNHAGTECPKCHEQSIVRHTDDMYCCLNCDFKRKIEAIQQKNKQAQQESGGFLTILTSLGLGWILFLLLV
ncbi:MAG: hypothetical protein AAFV72_09875 [Cyanobacteria bacterium J06635_1]